jgi:hypothetical protein
MLSVNQILSVHCIIRRKSGFFDSIGHIQSKSGIRIKLVFWSLAPPRAGVLAAPSRLPPGAAFDFPLIV